MTILPDWGPVLVLPDRPPLMTLGEIMRRFHPSKFAGLQFALGQLHQLTKEANAESGPSPGSIQALVEQIEQITDECSNMGLTMSLKSLRTARLVASKALSDAILHSSGEGWPHLNRIIFDCGKRIEDELEGRVFFAIPSEKTPYFEAELLFGQETEDAFPSSKYDIKEAGRCLALGRNTACVFHLMRVLEIGLSALAKKFSVDASHTNWERIIGHIETAVNNIPNDPNRSATWRDDREFYSQCTSHFRTVKDAWRNYTAHARGKYDDQEALDMLSSVRGFMQTLSKRVTE